jgi:hypothetical protein
MRRLIDSISHNVPAALSEVVTLGRTLTKRAGARPEGYGIVTYAVPVPCR